MAHRVSLVALVFAVMLCGTQSAKAHYPWIKIDGNEGKHGTVLFYFEHAPKPGDGAYLDPFIERGTFWATSPSDDPQEIELADTKEGKLRWLQAELTAPSPRGVDLYTKWGVYRYGKTDTLLQYYARHIDARDAEAVSKLAPSKNLKLQLQPALVDGELSVRATWDGEPLANQEIALRSPRVAKSFKTNDDGVAIIPVDHGGQYGLRTKMVVKQPGEFGGKAYEEVHHHATLLMVLKAPE